MNMIVAAIRTMVQFGVSALLTWLTSVGIDVAGEAAVALEAGIFAVILGAVTALTNWAGQKWPFINKVVSLGLSNSTASYSSN